MPEIIRGTTDVTPADIGWTAGIIDGEGCVALVYAASGCRKLTHLHVTVTAVCRGTLEKLQSLWGGTIHKGRKDEKNRKPIYAWRISPKLAKPMLEAIEPHLVEKKEQVFFALLHQETLLAVGNGKGFKRRECRISDAVMVFRHELYRRLRDLKREVA